MKLGSRIFICYILIFVVCFYYPIDWMLDNLRVRYLEGVEDPLVDQANILAGIVGQQMEQERFDPDSLRKALDNVYSRELSARIYEFIKRHVDMQFYITDHTGKLVFDSENSVPEGRDYSFWRDVRLTLAGQYGARTTRRDPADNTSSVLYVAAPIMVKEKLAGVLTVAKPTTTINNFLDSAKPRIYRVGGLSLLATIILAFVASFWITRPIRRLTQYANAIREGKRITFPKLDTSEIGEMGDAFRKMQEALEGKKYIEEYVQALTHEIKSPLSAIRGGAELLEEDMPAERRIRFIVTIRDEANRIQEIVDRMLQLAELENRTMLKKREDINLYALLKTVLESKHHLIVKKDLTVINHIHNDSVVKGDSFLLFQACANLVQNAIDFSPQQGSIFLEAYTRGDTLVVTVSDEGSGVPAYATEKIFNKFFSLQRPDSGKKSTGLGLNFVREVAILHGGHISLANRLDEGVTATLELPR